jgi:NAD(P)H dehydrogenase (quinone)
MIIVTGANGKLGQEIVAALINRTTADKIVASARDPQKLEHHEAAGIGIRRADYDDVNSLVRAFDEIETLILIPSVAPIEQRMQQNRNVIEAAKATGISRIVFLSFMDVREDSPLPYAKAFADTEKALAESGLPSTNLRMSLYMDNFFDWPPFQVRDGAISLAAGDGRVAYISRADLADAAAAVAVNGGHVGMTYEMTGPASLNYDEVTAILSEVRGEPIRYNPITPDEHYALVSGLGIPEYLAKGSLGMAAACKQGAFDRVTSHVEDLTGQAPEDFLSFMNRQKGQKHRVKQSGSSEA